MRHDHNGRICPPRCAPVTIPCDLGKSAALVLQCRCEDRCRWPRLRGPVQRRRPRPAPPGVGGGPGRAPGGHGQPARVTAGGPRAHQLPLAWLIGPDRDHGHPGGLRRSQVRRCRHAHRLRPREQLFRHQFGGVGHQDRAAGQPHGGDRHQVHDPGGLHCAHARRASGGPHRLQSRVPPRGSGALRQPASLAHRGGRPDRGRSRLRRPHAGGSDREGRPRPSHQLR